MKTSDIPKPEAVHYLLPSRVVAIYQKHGFEPISGQFWRHHIGPSIACCGAGAVALHVDPSLLDRVQSIDGDTERASPALFAVSEVIHAPLIYVWNFTLGFDRGFNEAVKNEPPGISDDELNMIRRSGFFALDDGLKSGRLVAHWWQSKCEHAKG